MTVVDGACFDAVLGSWDVSDSGENVESFGWFVDAEKVIELESFSPWVEVNLPIVVVYVGRGDEVAVNVSPVISFDDNPADTDT